MNGKRIRNIYNPASSEPFKLSRSKIDNFIKCPRCFYLDRRLGISQPTGPAFTLNSAVDKLLKKEFDIHRTKGIAHPLMASYGIDAIPMAHEMLDEWRENFKGIQFYHKETNLIITGAIDDIWVKPDGELIIVDYKATSKDGEVTLDDEWKDGYKRQMEIYQWLFRRNEFKVSDTGYFVYCNGKTENESFDGKLDFKVNLIPYTGDDSWVEETLESIHQCLISNNIPDRNFKCDYCNYTNLVSEIDQSNILPAVDLVLSEEKQTSLVSS